MDEALSWDHNSDNIADMKRLKSEHPGEKFVVYQVKFLLFSLIIKKEKNVMAEKIHSME